MPEGSYKALRSLQEVLENYYSIKTKLDVRDFTIAEDNFQDLGRLLVEQSPSDPTDLDVALILDRDLFSAIQGAPNLDSAGSKRAYSVVFEELSHFVYLCFNHHRGRNITRLEMEIQSEVDRILLAFHGPLNLPRSIQESLWEECLHQRYSDGSYEESRQAAVAFLKSLSSESPGAWTSQEIQKLTQFFHSDLGEKLHLSRLPAGSRR